MQHNTAIIDCMDTSTLLYIGMVVSQGQQPFIPPTSVDTDNFISLFAEIRTNIPKILTGPRE